MRPSAANRSTSAPCIPMALCVGSTPCIAASCVPVIVHSTIAASPFVKTLRARYLSLLPKSAVTRVKPCSAEARPWVSGRPATLEVASSVRRLENFFTSREENASSKLFMAASFFSAGTSAPLVAPLPPAPPPPPEEEDADDDDAVPLFVGVAGSFEPHATPIRTSNGHENENERAPRMHPSVSF